MRKEKQLLLDDIKDQLQSSQTFLLMKYGALNANDANSFRTQLAKCGSSVEVMRKRVLIKAAGEIGVQLDLKDLPGHIAIVFGGTDPIETTKMVFKFGESKNKVVEVVGGRFDGCSYSADQVKQLSELPGINEMRGQFLAVLEAPLSQTLGVMDALISSVVYCLDNKCKQDQNQDQTPEKSEE